VLSGSSGYQEFGGTGGGGGCVCLSGEDYNSQHAFRSLGRAASVAGTVACREL